MPSKGKIWGKASSWIFILGVIIAIIVGLAIGAEVIDPFTADTDTPAFIAAFLGALGFIAGILAILGMGTIRREELPIFMLATLIIIAIGANTLFGDIKWFGPYLNGITTALAIFIAPMAGLIAIKAMWDVGKD